MAKMCGGAHLLGSLRLRGRLVRDGCSEGARGDTLTQPWAAAAVGFAAAAMVCYTPLGVLGRNWCARGSWLGGAPSRGWRDNETCALVLQVCTATLCRGVHGQPAWLGLCVCQGAVGGRRPSGGCCAYDCSLAGAFVCHKLCASSALRNLPASAGCSPPPPALPRCATCHRTHQMLVIRNRRNRAN